jgi:hypothetical protein
MVTRLRILLHILLLFAGITARANPLLPAGGNGAPPHTTGAPGQPYNGIPYGDADIVYKEYILKKGENAEEKIRKNIFIRVTVDKKSCYVGEALLVTYKLFTRLKSVSNLTRNPSLNGFSVLDMQPSPAGDFSIEKVDGKEYNVFLLRKAQLYPLQAGTLQLDIAEVENNIRFIKEAYFENQPEYQYNREQYLNYLTQNFDNTVIPAAAIAHHKVTISSNPVSITVKDFPAAGKPAGFSGVNGSFRIKATLEKKELTTGDAGKLLVTISGAGNMTLITAPEIRWPEGAEAFEPKVSEDLSKENIPVSGARYFEFSFTVSRPGKFTIPPVSLSYFDAASGRYKTDSTQPLSIEVAQGNGSTASTTAVTQGSPERFFNKMFTNRWWVAGPVIGLILCGLLVWLRNENKKDKKAAAIAIQRTQQQKEEATAAIPEIPGDPLAPAAEQLQKGTTAGFYTMLNSCLKNYLSVKLAIPPAELNKKTLADALDKKGTANSISLAITSLLDDIEWQLYTPFAEAGKMEEYYQRAVEVTASLNYS